MNTLMLDDIDGLSEALAELRCKTGALVQKWSAKGDSNELVIELASAMAEADSLSRLIDSIVDGTEEMVPMEDLRERFVKLKIKIGILIGRYKAFHEKGIGF